jgi:hypothetical protein
MSVIRDFVEHSGFTTQFSQSDEKLIANVLKKQDAKIVI